MARLFISYKSDEQAYAFAVRQWLIDDQGWSNKDVFVDKGHLGAGAEWETTLLTEAETAEVVLFLASEMSIDIRSFCYRELRAARGQIIAVTLKGLSTADPRLLQALPERAKARQIEALDQQPVEGFDYVSPKDNTRGSIALSRRQLESIGNTLRDLGIAPDSFSWTPREEGPFPGLRALQEGDEAIFCGRSIDIRDGLKALDDFRDSVTEKALLIQAPSGAGKSSFLRAGVWKRLRRSAAFTPLAIIRANKGAVRNPTWGLIAGLYDTLTKVKALRERLPLSRADLAGRVRSDLPGLLSAYAEADTAAGHSRTLLLGIDQAEEVIALAKGDAEEFDGLLRMILNLSSPPDIRLVLTVRDDSLDATRERLFELGLKPESIATWRLNRLPRIRLGDVIIGPAAAACRAGWPLTLQPALVDALAQAAGETGEGGDALPILAVALQKLVEEHRAPNGEIALPPSQAKLFLNGAVEAAVEKALETADATVDDLRRLIIPRLATWDPQAGSEGSAKRVVASADRLFDGNRASLKALADALIAQRLLTSSQTETGTVYEVAHEALLRVAPLGPLIYERREKFEQQRILMLEAREWVASGESMARLARLGERLKDALALLADDDFGQELKRESTNVALYLAACRQRNEEEKGLSASARLDQLKQIAPEIWLDIPQMTRWLDAAENLLFAKGELEGALAQVEAQITSLRVSSSKHESDERLRELQFRRDTIRTAVVRLSNADRELIAAGRHIVRVAQNGLSAEDLSSRWNTAIAEISDTTLCPRYQRLRIQPQDGLVPLQRNKRTGLWEFLHLVSGQPPQLDSCSDEIHVQDDTGIVLVLLPGGSFSMGCVKPSDSHSRGPNVDPYARPEEGPIHTVSVEPFFMAKFPMTQGQWFRCTGQNPSFFQSGNLQAPSSLAYPVECVSWYDCTKALSRVGLCLPTEAEWEYAARAGTSSIWWCGDDVETLIGRTNLVGARGGDDEESKTSPVGHDKFENSFGLSDVIGNVWEWCQDLYEPYAKPFGLLNQIAEQKKTIDTRVCRGGSFFNTVEFGRSAVRYFHVPRTARFTNLGLRPSTKLGWINEGAEHF